MLAEGKGVRCEAESEVSLVFLGRIVGGHSFIGFRGNHLAVAQRVYPGGDVGSIGNQISRALCESGLSVNSYLWLCDLFGSDF